MLNADFQHECWTKTNINRLNHPKESFETRKLEEIKTNPQSYKCIACYCSQNKPFVSTRKSMVQSKLNSYKALTWLHMCLKILFLRHGISLGVISYEKMSRIFFLWLNSLPMNRSRFAICFVEHVRLTIVPSKSTHEMKNASTLPPRNHIWI